MDPLFYYGMIFGLAILVLMIIILVLIKKLKDNNKNHHSRNDEAKQYINKLQEDINKSHEDKRILLNKYLFLIKELNQNPGRIVDLFGSINGTSTNPEGPIEWVVEIARKNEEYKELCNDIKNYFPEKMH